MRAHETCIQDGTRLNFTRRGQTHRLEPDGAVARGLHLHTTLAVDPDGVALGVLRAAFDAPGPPTPEKDKPKPREARTSAARGWTWRRRPSGCPKPAWCARWTARPTSSTFLERRAHAPQVDLLVRAKVDRVNGEDARRADLAPSVRRGAQRAGPRRRHGRGAAAERAGEGQQTGPQGPPGGARRRGDTALPARGAALPRGRGGRAVGRPCARATAAAHGRAAGVVPADHAACEAPPRHAHPALVRPHEYFRVLKSGCKVEELQHHAAERLERAMAIKMVIGWRIQLMVQLGREVPDLPGDLLFSMASCACSPPSPARARCRHPRASATPSVWSGASAGGSGARATRPARNSCGTATPSSNGLRLRTAGRIRMTSHSYKSSGRSGARAVLACGILHGRSAAAARPRAARDVCHGLPGGRSVTASLPWPR